MSNYWSTAGIPHKGWEYETVIDLKEEGEDYETCMMCGKEEIRYVHIVSHDEVAETYRVGCVCAEKMTSDYVNPKERQRKLENRAKRKENWKYKEWKQSQKGNQYFKFEGHLLLIYTDKRSGKFRCKIDETFGSKSYNYVSEAKAGIFEKIEELKEQGNW
ncbi:MAG: hypothetical protein J7619_25200 [Dyadobacter sp.]|uniref:hypothetical protein n=1 Tax=Dyadobacter sp. TaxID=1914288 RepID=UPI001B1F2877|nr:hypothetical protein [Dyadobacter sp.]MBO9616015.1 hypothetical protein [Dyadobacter sp.]